MKLSDMSLKNLDKIIELKLNDNYKKILTYIGKIKCTNKRPEDQLDELRRLLERSRSMDHDYNFESARIVLNVRDYKIQDEEINYLNLSREKKINRIIELGGFLKKDFLVENSIEVDPQDDQNLLESKLDEANRKIIKFWKNEIDNLSLEEEPRKLKGKSGGKLRKETKEKWWDAVKDRVYELYNGKTDNRSIDGEIARTIHAEWGNLCSPIGIGRVEVRTIQKSIDSILKYREKKKNI